MERIQGESREKEVGGGGVVAVDASYFRRTERTKEQKRKVS